jgi:hypothetical protein
MVLVIVAIGTAGGVAVGTWMGRELAQLYLEFYRFPELQYALGLDTVVISVGVTVVAALGGTLYAVWQAVDLQPARAMQPEPPATYRETIVERLGLKDVFDQPTRMILRHLERRPLKALLSMLGIALSIAILMTGIFFGDAIDFMVDVQFNRAQRQDLSVAFTGPTSRRALYELQALRGVNEAEPFRSVPVRFRHEHHEYRTGIEGLAADPVCAGPSLTSFGPSAFRPRA